MARFGSLMHRTLQCQCFWRQHLMVKYLERTFIYALQRPLVGRRYYCDKIASQRSEDLSGQRLRFLTKSLGMPMSYTRMNYYDELDKMSLEALKDAMKVLENEGIQKLDIYNNLQILPLSPLIIRKRSRCLKEFGFAADAPEIIKYKFLMMTTSKTLHNYGVLPETVNPFENIMKNLECSPQLQTEISAACTNPDQMPLQKLREMIIKHILVHHLGFIKDESSTLRLLIHSQCVSDVHRLIQIFRKELYFSHEFIINHIALLRKCPDDIIQIMRIAKEYQLDLKYMLDRNPVILTNDPETVALKCRYLFDFGISSTQIMHNPSIFKYSMKHISDALETISKWPEFFTLKIHDNFTDALIHFKKADLHMKYLKKAGFERCSLDMLLAKDEAFKERLYRGENSKLCKAITCYISTVLEAPHSDVIAGLRHHPWFSSTSINNIKDVLTFLLAEGFTRRQILNGLALVLYPKGKVDKAYHTLPTLDIVQPYKDWVDNDNILQLLLYIIEKGEYVFLKRGPDTESAKLIDKGKQS